ncbi:MULTISPECIES: hypothetical protein [Streptacidiphilus]|uniref:Uncharacterized protein n=1 Tax=Streptacidiphilus cavernicola TaxID=3342716 RepID=A0ABV6V1D0_9ACTN|nr:hypothetical protein [Streptacidiphilus jeojiense]
MPKGLARKNQLSAIKTAYGLTHTDATALLDHPNAAERGPLCEILQGYEDVTTYKGAVAPWNSAATPLSAACSRTRRCWVERFRVYG